MSCGQVWWLDWLCGQNREQEVRNIVAHQPADGMLDQLEWLHVHIGAASASEGFHRPMPSGEGHHVVLGAVAHEDRRSCVHDVAQELRAAPAGEGDDAGELPRGAQPGRQGRGAALGEAAEHDALRGEAVALRRPDQLVHVVHSILNARRRLCIVHGHGLQVEPLPATSTALGRRRPHGRVRKSPVDVAACPRAHEISLEVRPAFAGVGMAMQPYDEGLGIRTHRGGRGWQELEA